MPPRPAPAQALRPAPRQQHALPDHKAEHVGGAGAQSHADADFVAPLRHAIGDHAVDADGGEQDGDAARTASSAKREARGASANRASPASMVRTLKTRLLAVHGVDDSLHFIDEPLGVGMPHQQADVAVRILPVGSVERWVRPGRTSPSLRTAPTIPTTSGHSAPEEQALADGVRGAGSARGPIALRQRSHR